jgi:hypothetical protein
MTVFSSAIPSVLHAHNATVKAWCLTARVYRANANQTEFDSVNFIDGYNLRLDVESQLNVTTPNVYTGALKFSFITPMIDSGYKVFLQTYALDNYTYPTYCHVINSTEYPKTANSFWVRVGLPRLDSADANRIIGVRLGDRELRLGVVVL